MVSAHEPVKPTICWEPVYPDPGLTPEWYYLEIWLRADGSMRGDMRQTTIYKEWINAPPEGWNQLWAGDQITETSDYFKFTSDCQYEDLLIED